MHETVQRHVPLAEFINAFIDAGLRLDRLSQPEDEPVPNAILIEATKPAQATGSRH